MGLSPTSGQPETFVDQPTRDPVRDFEVQQKIQAEQSLVLAIIVGTIAAIFAAIIWTFISSLLQVQFEWMAVGLGIFVGLAVRKAGRGKSAIFGIVGAALSLISCIVGNLLTVAYFVSKSNNLPIQVIIQSMILEPKLTVEVLIKITSFIDLMFYVLAILFGYFVSLRRLSQRELAYIYKETNILEDNFA